MKLRFAYLSRYFVLLCYAFFIRFFSAVAVFRPLGVVPSVFFRRCQILPLGFRIAISAFTSEFRIYAL